MKTLLTALLLLSLGAGAQTVNGKIAFAKGQKLELRYDLQTEMKQDMGGQSMDMKINGQIIRSLDIENVEGGNATIEHKVKRVVMDISSPMFSQKMDSENADDLKGESGKILEKSLKNKYTMTVGPDGKILSVTADDDNPNKNLNAEQREEMAAAGMGQLAAGMFLPGAGQRLELALLPVRNLAKGDSWTDTTDGKMEYTVTDITADNVLLAYKRANNTERTQETMGMEMKISLKETGSGTVRIDRRSGLLREQIGTLETSGIMDMMGQTIPMNTKTSVKITVTPQ